MLAVLFSQEKGLYVDTVDDPVLTSEEVLVQVEACGVCGSDRQVVEGRMPLPFGSPVPAVLGHEIAGRICDANASSVHSSVLVYPFVPCGQCRLCQTGYHHLCLQQKVIGYQMWGGYAELVKVPKSQLIPYDGVRLTPEVAALLVDAFATPYHAIRQSHLEAGMTALVLGAGGLGVAAVMLLHVLGVRAMGLSSRTEGLALFERAGAEQVESLETDARALGRQIRRWSGGGVDVVLDTYGNSRSLQTALDFVRPGGSVMVLGMHDGDVQIAQMQQFVRKGITVTGSYASEKVEIVELISMAEQGILNSHAMIERVTTLHELPQVFETDTRSAGRIVVKPTE
ncbi:zinc-dependent alcohol dehydrogenase [Alicyclobacillus tolerans]|uniref:Alcohol dehydrogenase, propanol-preferring n=1 Tax=Alicyclobacillus tolerans TaxID=90970 RepID=A0A1M6MIJ3_9BACL|nr:alcohol dehydrogenase catalytic domain-containing protein [Alicyclobacillus montanus]SHJ83258.1 alcohol dehydrogenase, propanol-preferring [Alicyclobacillus montanus]